MLRTQSGTAPASANFARVSGLAALGFAFLIVAGNVVLVPAGLPRTGAGIGEVDEFFRTHGDLVGIGSAVTPVAWVLATLFGAGAVRVLWRSERDRGEAWALLGFAGLLLQNAVFAGVVAIRLALASTAADGVGAATSLWALHDALFTLNGTFLAVALAGLSLAGLRAGLIRPWHGRWGLVSAALLSGSAVLTPLVIDHAGPLGLLGLVGWLMWVVWLVVYGVVLMRPLPVRPSPAGG
ncbi:2-oxoglutarate/malate transporter [Streptomyces lomondensis]|nr:2-oxoglutarate/malate transporter [Streptomyces lomondensis]MCF0079545.1 2-oxoglutarate/malate transporter [Streptomyces lomondensis]